MTTQHETPTSSPPRRLTKEAIDHLVRTRDAGMAGRRFAVSTTDLLREIRTGEPTEADQPTTPAAR